jgi:DNA-binding NarL/FixJ family response regulator
MGYSDFKNINADQSRIVMSSDRPKVCRSEDNTQLEWIILFQSVIDNLSETLSETPSQPNPEILVQLELAGFQYTLSRQCISVKGSEKLSPREQQVADLIAKGFSNKSIAETLSISPWTVSTYVKRMFIKWKVASRPALIARLVESGQV